MTIAGLYLSPEGVVLGADSTSSVQHAGNGYHYFDFGQKLFEIGENSSLGLITWGLGGLGDISYRALVAELADSLQQAPPATVAEVAIRWVSSFWPIFSSLPSVQEALALHAKPSHDPADPASRTREEEERWTKARNNLAVGFCIAGYVLPSRRVEAQIVAFQVGEPEPVPSPANHYALQCWGMPNIFNRLLYGVDQEGVDAVMSSGRWTGTEQELVQALIANPLIPRAHLPIRDAIDYVHSAIYCTIKGMKFSSLPQVCGGPIEIAVITSDRKFRWVRHKSLDAAIADGEPA